MKTTDKNQFPANPLRIFTLVDKLKNRVKGESAIANAIKNTTEPNYYKIIAEVKQYCQNNETAMAGIIGIPLVKEILQFEIPEYLIKH